MLTPTPRIGKFAGPEAAPATVKRVRRKREKATKAVPKPSPALMPPGLINQ